ncbi:S-adenosyl-L-methionine-dependent methyltransferase [Mytilinidion resinicola]|uniref:RNA methyltransferase n=1 Tax=Mytilinidion resinicola TaxID=574789 RepID=A0A6A6YJW3_9PEZI|nr:S-adenosyl-L-methionine-dependent methyltransferase [Mytilinidion resinicola]KAF2808848.1 S-adenosyl-L-methionine-dependent methyltransferase [Mytilinidion resinicola]
MTAVGNYHRYQGAARHVPDAAPSPHIKERRLAVLDGLIPGLFADGSAVLDVGCNAGAVTVQLAHFYDTGSVTGVDVDPQLIEDAGIYCAFQSSRIRPATADSPRQINYFPISAIHDVGPRIPPLPATDEDSGSDAGAGSPLSEATPDLQTVQFICEDWVISQNPKTSGPYDVILALSVVKWIHLKHLDAGLEAFFRKCASSLKEGGYFVIEVQSWNSYLTAIAPGKTPHFKNALDQLKHRPETSYTELLEQNKLVHVATSEELPRRISVYRKA